MRFAIRSALLALVSCLALSLSVAVGAAQTKAEWDQVIADAKKEGKVVLYTGHVGVSFHGDVAKLFEQRYGIKVEILEARASELRERIRSEQAAGRYLADVSHNGSTTTVLQMRTGTFQPHGPLPSLGNLIPPFKADEMRVPIFILAYGILVNTDLVKPADEPKSWRDLADPKWKGKILSDEVRALGGGSVFFFVTEHAFGDDFHRKLAQQQIQFSRDLRLSERRVARGEFSIWIPQVLSDVPQLKGLPVKLIIPEEGCTYVTYELALLKNAPHPNAARLLMEFFLEPEAQLIYANGGNGVTVKGIAEQVPADIRPLAAPKLLGSTNADEQDAMLKLANDIYK
jgi:iron(III) transport system substrate-binding protein